MEIYLVSNNLFENNLSYNDRHDIEKKKMTRPLSVEGELLAKKIAVEEMFADTKLIYSSMFSSSLASAKYLAERINKKIIVDEDLNDCKVGELGSRNLKTVKFMQNHDFNIKLNGGESLTEVGNRISRVINRIINLDTTKVVVYTHKRAMLGYLVLNCDVGYNLDDNLVVEYNEKVIYSDTLRDADIIKLTIQGRKLVDVDVIDL